MRYIEKGYGNGVWELKWTGQTLAEVMSYFCEKHPELRVTAMNCSKLLNVETCVVVTEQR
jgi:hypothetical protein